MSLKPFAFALIAAAAVAVGCDDSSSTPAANTTATPSAGATNDRARSAATDLQTQAAGAQDSLRTTMDGATTRASDAAANAKASASDTGNAVVAQAQALYEKARTAIGNAKLDDAQTYVDQLKVLRDKLPAEWQARVDQLGTMLTDAKAKMGNLKMPAMPK